MSTLQFDGAAFIARTMIEESPMVALAVFEAIMTTQRPMATQILKELSEKFLVAQNATKEECLAVHFPNRLMQDMVNEHALNLTKDEVDIGENDGQV